MAASERSKGDCAYCGREMTRGGMARHLAGCEKRGEAVAAADAKPGTSATLVHLQVRDAGAGDYWLSLEVDADTTLKQVDGYLRAIWLECCGHLSRFSAGGWGSNEVAMSRRVGTALPPGTELTHVYDFGTESVTLLKAVAVRQGKRTTRHPIALMARNTAPDYACQECGATAARLCIECIYEHEASGMLCGEHAAGHPHDDYGEPLAVVNSPRMGLCGYEGPAEPPY